MRTISSAEFRKTYPRLIQPMTVTVNGHKLGEWRPASIKDGQNNVAFVPVPDDLREAPASPERLANAQAERDAILRRINKGA